MTGFDSRTVFADLAACLTFFTRLPLPPRGEPTRSLGDAIWAAPLMGFAVAIIATFVFTMADLFGVPQAVGAALALATAMLVTGCLHEDGLADVADGFGGGATPERKLEIMRDSRLGTYGAAALMLSILARWACLVTLDNGGAVVAGLIAAHVGSRGIFALLIQRTPLARDSGLAGSVGTVSDATVIRALAIGAVGLFFLGVGGAIVAALLAAAVIYAFRALCLRQIGGITGDTLGAAQQLAEIAILVAASALLT